MDEATRLARIILANVAPKMITFSQWEVSEYYNRHYMYVYGDDHTILETLWGKAIQPSRPKRGLAAELTSEWAWSPRYKQYYRLKYGDDRTTILKTIWAKTPTDIMRAKDRVKDLLKSPQSHSGFVAYQKDLVFLSSGC